MRENIGALATWLFSGLFACGEGKELTPTDATSGSRLNRSSWGSAWFNIKEDETTELGGESSRLRLLPWEEPERSVQSSVTDFRPSWHNPHSEARAHSPGFGPGFSG